MNTYRDWLSNLGQHLREIHKTKTEKKPGMDLSETKKMMNLQNVMLFSVSAGRHRSGTACEAHNEYKELLRFMDISESDALWCLHEADSEETQIRILFI